MLEPSGVFHTTADVSNNAVKCSGDRRSATGAQRNTFEKLFYLLRREKHSFPRIQSFGSTLHLEAIVVFDVKQ